SKTRNGDIEISLCLPPSCVGNSIAGGFGVGRMKSNFESVTEQSGLWAGDGGFQIDVQNNTRLIGGVIASSDAAIADRLNKLGTGTLVTEDIKNTAHYSAHQVSVSGGVGFGGEKSKDSGLGTTKDGQVAGGATKESGTSASTGAGGLGMGMPMVAAARGSSSSITYSAISAGDLFIRDEAAQQDLTGMTATETIASLKRDTSDTLNTLRPIFDKDKIEAGFEIAQEASRQVGQFLENRAKEADTLKRSVDAEQDPALKALLKAQYDEAAKWSPDGEYRLAMTVLTGAASANVAGSVAQYVQSAAASYLQALGAREVKSVADALHSETARVALQGLIGCAGAAGAGQDCSAAAMGAAASVVVNNLMEGVTGRTADQLNAEAQDAHVNLVKSLVAGLSTALGGDAAVATLAAQLETQANYLGQKSPDFRAAEQKQFDDAIAACGPGNPEACARARELGGLSEQRNQGLARACADGDSQICRAAIKLATTSGNVVFFDGYGSPVVVPADSPMIQATPNLRDGTFHYGIAASVAEGLALDVGGGAFSGIASAVRGVLKPLATDAYLPAKGLSVSTGAENAALVPKLKVQLAEQNLRNIAAQDFRLAAAIKGSGTKNPNFSIGQGTYAEAEHLGKIWVGDGAKPTSDGLGLISADGTRGYRPPTRKASPFATTGVQANYETYQINPVTGRRIKVSDGHLNIAD
ncbi:DUF6862 domain-containing protein, partial [Bordetella sp. 02P26C-1]|uniref:DUF6862 domain-containing protein n=1 Tax=Bordetella sp. 02P26C-1 TaxID=2683195 RepID=UPI0030152482